MIQKFVPAPAFGEADLSNCEREQIHLAGSIQPHGALLLCSEPALKIVLASENASEFLGLVPAGEHPTPIGMALDELPGTLASRIRPQLRAPLRTQPLRLRCTIGTPPRAINAMIHRPAGGGVLIELEPAGPVIDVVGPIEAALQTILGSVSLASLCDETARIFKALTGYDRVMVYKFDDEGHGHVFAEQREPGLEPYLANRYPASDIPQIARRLYERHRVRMLVDVAFKPVRLHPALSPISGAPLDMSLCALRSSSPIHVQYLQNMGVRATLVVSLMVGGQLWGLIACHHYAPFFVAPDIRAACEFLAEAVATRIAAFESFVLAQAELAARRLEQRMAEALSREGNWKSALFDNPPSLLHPVRATGAALLFDNEVTVTGDVPGTQDIRAIGAWLDSRAPQSGAEPTKLDQAMIITASLAGEAQQFEAIKAAASGVLAVSLSSEPGTYLIWVRPEQVRTVTWGGDPTKPVTIGDTPADLSPRRSFAQWHQVMRLQSEPWTEADIAAARLIGAMVSDVVLQSRSVRMLIAQDQLERVRREVAVSTQPVIVADVNGDILLINRAFTALVAGANHPLQSLSDLPPLFVDADSVADRLQALRTHRLSWRGEIAIRRDSGEALPLLIRADPILATADRVLGFALIMSDMSEQKAASVARRRFQDGIIEQNRTLSGLIASKEDMVVQTLLKSVFENAQLAALEITDRLDPSRMPEMLESVRDSVRRTTAVLQNLFIHDPPGDEA
ncbi:GAF domain-containing protein [Acidiphilium sp. PA]|uniref:GAF domain-containing protein n=1 Tax=Acidiphilium sp. PA TaxID=2871705 RepID=UPI002243DAFB|nr:GAF domain-containing protein [Acidiphilium sp. PA]MCW8306825.1 GAF domain-containing protein [Acidiphilium sp. PA]